MFIILAWLFAAAVVVHNLEEAFLLPAWSEQAGRWHRPVGVREFRFAVLALTALAGGAALLAAVQGRESFGAYVLSGYALAMLLNVVFPHLLATIVMRRYMPGTATALALNLPVTVALLRQAFEEGYISSMRFALAGPAVVLAIVLSIPALFYLGRKLWPDTAKASRRTAG
ncbi:MAG: HXXEE domain-containing protein [Mesorhizobium sp.]|uniref:HXXEE domain-containing protein n=1 Tax=Mesorhizobium sp. TaxID=1871066 RepID=UPI000FE39B2B|nr:HXXEE domain-containing protein [Mesorhizobium sp.]RWK19183.1 MAG: HXXEE domain-containing protein [Mesorhizobium sp.]RWK32446.1 MAG: HXXEE domain-containing protein [Mesorhizobium sp.]